MNDSNNKQSSDDDDDNDDNGNQNNAWNNYENNSHLVESNGNRVTLWKATVLIKSLRGKTKHIAGKALTIVMMMILIVTRPAEGPTLLHICLHLHKLRANTIGHILVHLRIQRSYV